MPNPLVERVRRVYAAAALIAIGGLLSGCDRTPRAEQVPAATDSIGDPALSALADSLLPALERLSWLDARASVRLERRAAEQVRAYVRAQLEEEMPDDELDGVRSTYALLGLIPDTLDVRALLLELYAEQIVGYYDPEEKKLFVVAGMPAEAVRPVVAHELVHALQDQHTNLDSLIARDRGNDRQSAAQAAIEGHATLVMFALLAEEATGQPVDPIALPNPGDQIRPGLEAPSGDFPVFRRAPRIVRETLLFPYIGGARFVQELWRSQPEGERQAPLGPLLPQSTEQVLEPVRRFIAERDEPTALRLEDDTTWTVVYENGLGRLETGLLLEEHLGQGADSAAAGWDGDRYRLLRSPAGERALVWYSVWDDAAAADRFATAMETVILRLTRSGSAERLEIEGRPAVRVILSSTPLTGTIPDPAVRIEH